MFQDDDYDDNAEYGDRTIVFITFLHSCLYSRSGRFEMLEPIVSESRSRRSDSVLLRFGFIAKAPQRHHHIYIHIYTRIYTPPYTCIYTYIWWCICRCFLSICAGIGCFIYYTKTKTIYFVSCPFFFFFHSEDEDMKEAIQILKTL
jgi:hypothetical protein